MISNKQPMSINEWKTKVSQSSYLRKNETVVFSTSINRKTHLIYANIKTAPNVMLGCYFLTDHDENNI